MSSDLNSNLLEELQRARGNDADSIALIPPDELLPKARAAYEQRISELGVASIPIVLDRKKQPADASDDIDFMRASDKVAAAPSHAQYMSIGEYSHRWTEEYIVQHVAASNLDMAKLATIDNPEVIAAMEAWAEKLGIEEPRLYESEKTPNVAGQTAEGRTFIILDPNDSPERQITILSHEMGHLSNGHARFAYAAERHNAQDYSMDRSDELEADQTTIALCEANELSELLGAAKASLTHHAALNGEVFDREYQLAKGPTHPVIEDRIALLDAGALAQAQVGHCPLPPEVLNSLKSLKGGDDMRENDPPNRSGKANNGTALPNF